MKILHLIGGGDIGGAKVHVLSLVRQLSQDISIGLVSFRHGSFSKEAKKMGIDVHVIQNQNFFKDVQATIDLIKKEQYDLIHCHGAKGNIIGYLCKIKTKTPIISTVHSDYKLDYSHSLFKTLTLGLVNGLVLRKMDALVPVTQHFKKLLIQRRFNANRIYTIHNGMDFTKPIIHRTREQICEKYEISCHPDNVFVGILARLYPVKNIETLIEAAKYVKEKNPYVQFLIGGEGEDYKKLLHLVKKYDLEDTCHFLGWVSDPYEFMHIVDISVLTSISEGLPYSLLEGALLKKATIATAVGGIPDLITHNENGYLLQPKDVQALVGHILDLAKDKEKRDIFGEKLYQKAITDFSIQKMAQTQIHIYNEIHSWTVRGKRTYDIILSGYYGFGNIGDDALLYSIIFNLKRIEENIKILILSRNPVETSSLLGVDSISRFNLFEIISTMKKSALFIYGGGTLIQESTSTRSLVYYLSTMYLAKCLGLRTMLYANGVEPLKKRFNRIITKKVVNNIDLITLRESKSIEQLYALQITKPQIVITADPAVTTYPCTKERTQEIFQKEGFPLNQKYVGISVREWQGYEKRFIPMMAEYIDWLAKNHQMVPVFIPMQRQFVDDASLSQTIMAKMQSKAYMLNTYYTAEETMGIIEKLDLLVGIRLHSLIFAACCQTPLIGISYEPKVEWFMESIGFSDYIAGNVRDFTLERLKSLTHKAIENEKQIKLDLKKQQSLLRKKALHNAHLAIELKNKGEKA